MYIHICVPKRMLSFIKIFIKKTEATHFLLQNRDVDRSDDDNDDDNDDFFLLSCAGASVYDNVDVGVEQ